MRGWQHGDQAGGYLLSVTDPAQAAPSVARALVAAGADVLSIPESRHTLEDVYLELVSDTRGEVMPRRPLRPLTHRKS